MARTTSDEASAKTTGGKQPWYDQTSPIDAKFNAAIFAPGLKPGDIAHHAIFNNVPKGG